MNLEELYKKIQSSDELKSDLQNALQSGKKQDIVDFMKKQGCDATVEEAKSYLEQLGKEALENGELTPEQIEMAAGGSFVATGLALALVSAAFGFVAVSGGKIAQKSCS